MAATPNFAAAPRMGIGRPTAANTGRDGSGALVNILTGAANGTRVDRIEIQSGGSGAPVTTCMRLFVHDGTTAFLIKEVLISAPPTPNNTTLGYQTTINFPVEHPLVLPNANWSLKCCQSVLTASPNDLYNVTAHGADL